MGQVAKIIELVGSSEVGWTEAAQVALEEAKKSIKGVTRHGSERFYGKSRSQ